MEDDTLKKRVLFETWLEAHRDAVATLAFSGEPIDRRRVLARLTSLAGQQRADDYVYVLLERRPNEETPAYIGRATSPARRWMQHLTALAAGTGSYARWRTRLLREGHDTARFDLELLVVGQTHLQFPPLPGFPTTIGAVESQLVNLAADAYPLRLLNDEGQGR
ncbi:GIY-YIG nuclease family protein (plasmid) [Deinococcus sp. KNUC1210]|uniref:GIY-YIG nuclease family protein n=1 Tax=Deinococcus sp. KNUC1210 TaxID=2917691 RepID=UPI001EF0F488|nr:GIY-YIG nuclease family protein [Deinococcus sp. KNUC1210]ULH18363.1 GIY-YIG nuclease family protein [Deinococcus sp. KNUC1210]